MDFNLSDTTLLSATTKAFVNKDESILKIIDTEHPFYSFDKALEGKSTFSQNHRKTLVKVLNEQYKNIIEDGGSIVRENINALLDSNTYTVTTGQQLHLFLGPAFVIYKILGIVNLAETLNKQYPDKKFIPIYWLASEDHDFDEIKKTKLFNNEYTWETSQNGACGRFTVDGVSKLINQIRSDHNLNEENLELLDTFEKIYQTSKTLSEASQKIVHNIFKSYGVICLDPDNKELKSEIIPLIKNDLLNQKNKSSFDELSQKLLENGLSNQLHVRKINFFYLENNLRNRIEYKDSFYEVIGTDIKFTEKELIFELENHPEKFSPNAMMRPLYQESILPNIAYMGGNAELTYWIQASNVFIVNNINSPRLFLRPSVWIIPSKIMSWLKKQEINPLELLISQNSDNLLSYLGEYQDKLKDKINSFSELKKDIQDTVNQNNIKDFSSLVEQGKTYEKLLKSIHKEIIQYHKEKDNDRLTKLEDIFHNILSFKSIQERKTDSIEMLIRYKNVVFSVKSADFLKPEKAGIISL